MYLQYFWTLAPFLTTPNGGTQYRHPYVPRKVNIILRADLQLAV